MLSNSKQAKSKNIKEVINNLRVNPEYRSFVTNNLIADFIKNTKSLSSYILGVPDYDLKKLASVSTIKEGRGDGSNISIKNEYISTVYIILSGVFHSIDPNGDEEVIRTYQRGDILGFEFLDDEFVWKQNIFPTLKEYYSMLCISASTLTERIGKHGTVPEEYMTSFWQYMKLSREANCISKVDNILPVDLPFKYYQRMLSKTYDSTINLINISKIRIYNPGSIIFEQNEPRNLLYLIISGECELIRQINELKLTTKQKYYSSDYIFLDSNNISFIEIYKQNLNLKNNQNNKKSVNLYGNHNNSLIANTRVELCVIPFTELFKNLYIITKLLQISIEKYKFSFKTNEVILNEYTNENEWKLKRINVLNELGIIRLNNLLSEKFYLSVNNNVTENYYFNQKPWNKQSYLLNIKNYYRNGNSFNNSNGDNSTNTNQIENESANEIKPEIELVMPRKMKELMNKYEINDIDSKYSRENGIDGAGIETPNNNNITEKLQPKPPILIKSSMNYMLPIRNHRKNKKIKDSIQNSNSNNNRSDEME